MTKKKVKPSKTLVFKLDGNKIKPQSFSAREVATIILNLEDSLRVVAKNKNPELDESYLYVSLVDVINKSNSLKFVPSIAQVASAFVIVANSFQANNFENIPRRAINSLKEIQKVISHKEGCVGTFISGRTKISQISKTTDISIPEARDLVGETVIYGKIQRIGGTDPKVVLRLHNGDLLSLDVTEKLAQSFGPRLYTEVGLKGIATWSYDDKRLLSFKVESLTSFDDQPIDIAFSQLRGSLGTYWDEIDDIKEALLME